MQTNVYKVCTCDYVNMCGTADSLMLTVCSDANGSVRNESAIIQFSSAIYFLCVLTEQQRDRRNIKYRQQTETHRQQVMTNHTVARTAQTVLQLWKGNLWNDRFVYCTQSTVVMCCVVLCCVVLCCCVVFSWIVEGKDSWWVNSWINNKRIHGYCEICERSN